ncbi:putative ribonuclease H-like domain-containing protein [Tanacetum coccineum]
MIMPRFSNNALCNRQKKIYLNQPYQGNSQVKDNKIDLLVQQYEQFVISEDESIDSAFTRFNIIITSLKALDEGLGSTSSIKDFALRNFGLEVMEFESAHSNTTVKLPILKLVPVTAEEKTNKKNDVKARSLLLMDLPNEHQLTFRQYNYAKTMFAVIETRFGVITQEDLNSNFLTSLPPEWNTHVVVWMNKAEIETMSIDDLYNNFKIVEQSVKKSVGASSGAQNLAFMTAPSTSSTNDVNTTKPAYEVSTVSPNVNTASPQVSTASFSDNVVYAFMVENPNGSNLLQQDLEQIHEDDLEAMDLKWQLSLLSMRAKRWDTLPRNVEHQGTKRVQTNLALMAFSDSEVYNDKTCSKTYLKNYETLKKQCDDLIVKLNQTEFTAATYKKGLETVEENLSLIERNEVLFSVEVAVSKRKCLQRLWKINITDKSKKGLGYNAIPPPHPLIYNRPKKLDLSYFGLDEFKDPEFKSYGSEDSKQESNIGKPLMDDKGFLDSGCSRHMTRNIAYLIDFKEFDGDVYFVTECLVLSPNFKLPDEKSLTCLVAKATLDESMLWHRRLGHINFKNINKLVKDNLVRGLPTKRFENDQTCIACLKGKQHKASCKSKVLNPITKPLFMLHMDLFGPTFVSILMHKKYCLVVTDDYSRFTWVFFLATKDETSGILKNFIKEIKNLVDKKVKIIRCDNETEFKNKVMDDFCREKGIRREYSIARTPQQNGVNRVLVVKPHNKTPYELFRGFKPALSFMRPFGCHVTILNTLDNLGKFDGKSDKGFFVGYSLSSKAFRVYNIRTMRVEENLHIGFLENKPIIEGNGPKWLFYIDSLTQSMNYVPVAAGTITNESCLDASYFDSPSKDVGNGAKSAADDQKKVEDGPDNETDEKDKSEDDSSPKEVNTAGQHVNTASPEVNTGRFKLNTVDPSVNTASSYDPDSPKDMFKIGASHTLETTHVEFFSDKDEPEVDLGNITNSYTVLTTPNTRVHKDHPIKNVIGDVKSSIQTKRMTKSTFEQGFLSAVYEQKTHDTLNTYLYACFLSHIEPASIIKALSDSSWVEAMQEELLQFKLQQVWILMDLLIGKRAIGTKWVFRNNKDERGIVIRNKARLVAQGHRQEEGIDYEEVFAHVARIEAIRLFLAYASFMGFLVYQMDVKSAFLYGTIEEEVYVTQPPRFKDPDNPDKVYKVVKALYGLHQAPRAWYETLANYLLGNGFKRGKIDQTLFIKKQKGDILLVQVYVDDIIFGSTNKELCTGFEKLIKDKFQMSSMGELTFFLGLQVQQKEDGIFISQDKYVDEILKKFNYTDVKSASTPVDLEKPLVKDRDADDVDVHLYISMIGSLMYLTASRPDIMDSPFELVAYTDSDYAGATQDRKSTTDILAV